MNSFIEGIKSGDYCYVFGGKNTNSRYEIVSNKSGVITLDLSNMTKSNVQADKEYDINKYNLEFNRGVDEVAYEISCYLDGKKKLVIEVLINSENYLQNVLTFAEAAKVWKISDSTLRKMVNTGKLKENIHYKKSGSTWIITRMAMRKIYGEEKE